jgi:hypothetical protein
MHVILCILIALVLGCTTYMHREESWDSTGQQTYKWETKGSTFIAVKRVEFMIDTNSERAALAGDGISEKMRDVLLAQVAIEPELAHQIISAMRPGGQLEDALAELVKTEPALADAITKAMDDE